MLMRLWVCPHFMAAPRASIHARRLRAIIGLAAVTGAAAAAVPGRQLHAARGRHLRIRPQTRVAAGVIRSFACFQPTGDAMILSIDAAWVVLT